MLIKSKKRYDEVFKSSEIKFSMEIRAWSSVNSPKYVQPIRLIISETELSIRAYCLIISFKLSLSRIDLTKETPYFSAISFEQ